MPCSGGRYTCAALLVVASGAICLPHRAAADDLLNDNPTFSPFNLELRQYAQMPVGQNNVISMTTRLGDQRLYVTTQQGSVYVINQNPDGTGTPALWFNATNIGAGGVSMTAGFGQGGLQSIAFHPEFDQVGMPGYGKLFATMVRNHSAGASFLGDSPHVGSTPDGVLAEWTYNHDTGAFSGYRELFRVNMPVNDHPIKQARFNPYAQPGDEDYGLLYMTHGDSNSQHSPGDYPQLLSNALGKMIRVDPLDPDGAGSLRYSIPDTNPFASSSDPDVLKEVFAYGFRNPHNFSFNLDDDGNVHILVGNIGRANMEEVDLAIAGNNYGWPKREGTFVEKQIANNDPVNPDAGYITGVAPLPANEADFGYSFPVAQYDHNAMLSEVSSGSSVASGFVIRNGSDPNLDNQLILNNFADKDGIVYHADFAAMLAAVNKLDPDDPSRDDPSELTQAVLHKLNLALDHDNNTATAPQLFDDFSTLLSGNPASTTDRNDARYGEGVFGEMYISTKQNGGRIYLVTNSVPLAGDYNQDHVVDAADYTVWRNSLGEVGYHRPADGTGDGKVDAADYDVWQLHYGETWGIGGSGGLSHGVPEPAAGALLAIALAMLAGQRQRRDR